MAQARTTLKVSPRDVFGSRATRRLRKDGMVPGVVYGQGGEARPFQVPERDLRNVLQEGQTLLDLGYQREDIVVTPMRLSALSTGTTPPAGAVYALRFAEIGCVIGDVRRERVLAEVTGSAAEFGCLEPYSH